KALARQLGERMAESLLPGDTPLAPARLAEAAEFILEGALLRSEGEPSILVRTAPGRSSMQIAVVNDDMPFLVDSVAATIAAQDRQADRAARERHALIDDLPRDPAGRRPAAPRARAGARGHAGRRARGCR